MFCGSLLPIINPSYNLFTVGGLGHCLLAAGHVFIAQLIFLPDYYRCLQPIVKIDMVWGAAM